MKKLKLILLLAVLCTPFLQSCNSKIDQASTITLLTIRSGVIPGIPWYGVLDNGDKLYVGDASRIPNYTPKDGQRAFISFNRLETDVEGFKYNVAVYGVEEVLVKPTILLDDKQYDTLGRDNISITNAYISGGYLNVTYQVMHDGKSMHILNLAKVEDGIEDKPLEVKDGYTTLDLRHNAKGAQGGWLAKGFVCFRLNEYDPEYTGDKGLYIRCRPVADNPDGEGRESYITIDVEKKQ